MNQKRMKIDISLNLLMFIIGLTAYIAADHFSTIINWNKTVDSNAPFRCEAGTWPQLVCIPILILSGFLAVRQSYVLWKAQGQREVETDAPQSPKQIEKRRKNLQRSGVFGLIVLGYILLLSPIGFMMATLLLSIVCSLTMDTGSVSRAKCAAAGIFIAALIITLFCRIMYLPLPRGYGIFRDITQHVIFFGMT